MSAPTLDAFLVAAKEALQSARSNKTAITLVLGNEHPDLDSIASAIIFAYFRTASPPQNGWSPIYIPALNERRTDLLHQALLMRVLPHASIELQHLVALEDLVMSGTKSGLQEDLTRFFFVDHNLTLGREKQNYSHRVIGCIDHNHDEGYVPKDTEPEPRIITPAGSCTSLVVNYSRSAWNALQFGIEGSDAHLAKLALAAILVDTKDLESDATNKEDLNAVEFLLSRIKLSNMGGDFDRTAYYYDIIGEQRPQPVAEPAQLPMPELIPDPIPVPAPAEPVVVETQPVVVESEPEINMESIPVPAEEPIPEPQTTPRLELVVEIPHQATPELEYFPPMPAHTTEPAQILEPVFVETSPAVQALEEVPTPKTPPPTYIEPVISAQSPISPTSPSRKAFPRVYLDEVLAHDFETGYEGGGAIGISFTPMGLAEMIRHAERDLVERAINGEDTDKVLRGTPFTAAVRDFALERGLSVYAIRTGTRKGNELFIWVAETSMVYFIPRFVQVRAKELGLERWTDKDEITKEEDMNGGRMGAFWMRSDTGREAVKQAVMQGTTYIFFGVTTPTSPLPSLPLSPRRGFSARAVATK